MTGKRGVLVARIMVVCLLLLVAACSWVSHCWSGSLFPKHCGVVCSAVVVSGELCEFPSDHPIQDLESGGTVPVQLMDNNRVHIYTNWFDSCHGCVRSLRFCYRPQFVYVKLERFTVGLRKIVKSGITTRRQKNRASCIYD